MARRSRDIERTYSRGAFAQKLRRLADAVERGGAFTIQVAGERLRIPAGAEFNIEHERRGGGEEVEFQLRWASSRPSSSARRKPSQEGEERGSPRS